MQVLPRSAWTGVARPERRLTRLNADVVEGVAVHYTGSAGKLGDQPTAALSAQRLRSEWAQHVTGNGWTDIAYQYAIDQAGRCFQLRGFEYRSAANGTADVNRRFGAVTFLIGTGDTPTVAAVEAFRAWRAHVWLPQYPRAVKVVGHRDLHATQCPGTALYRLVTSGALSRVPVTIPTTPIPIGGLPVALDKADIRAIADALMSADAVYQVHVPGSDDTEGVTASLAELRRGVAEISARLDAIAERLPQ